MTSTGTQDGGEGYLPYGSERRSNEEARYGMRATMAGCCDGGMTGRDKMPDAVKSCYRDGGRDHWQCRLYKYTNKVCNRDETRFYDNGVSRSTD